MPKKLVCLIVYVFLILDFVTYVLRLVKIIEINILYQMLPVFFQLQLTLNY